MRASRIFAFARTIRCARVGAGVRNARAISSVVSPHTSRRVSATCASGDERRMTTGEDQPQPVVFDALRIRPGRRILDGDVHAAALILERIEPLAPAQTVDRFEPPGGHQPGSRVGWNAVAGPLLERGAKRIMERFFSGVEVADQPDQRRQDPARLGNIDGVHRFEVLDRQPSRGSIRPS